MDSIGAYYKAENYISHTNTSKGLINRLYKAVRKYTLGKKKRLLEKTTGKNNGRLLDLGAGTGAFVSTMQRAGWSVTGLEPDTQARQTARDVFQIDLQDISDFHLLTGHFDAITMWHVLEHVHDLNGYMKRLAKLLAPGGRLFIAVPNYTAYDAKVYGDSWAAWDVPRHLYHFSPGSMARLVEKHGMRITRQLPMWFDSFYVSMLSSKYRSGKTKLVPAIWNGFLSNIKAVGKPGRCSSVIYVVEVLPLRDPN
jgi:SAM-dependent methyltransferase